MPELSENLYLDVAGQLCFNEPLIKETLRVISIDQNIFGVYFFLEIKN